MSESPLIVKNGCVITPFRVLNDGVVIVRKGSIEYVGPKDEAPSTQGFQVVDAEGRFISPGFIDIHVHGGGGVDTMDGTTESLQTIAKTHAKGGSTSILPTTLTNPWHKIEQALKTIEEVVTNDDYAGGARILGAHVEGPYFSMEQKGAQNPDYLKAPKDGKYRELEEKYTCIKRFSAAPELEGALNLGKYLSMRGILVSIAHTNATYGDVLQAVESGYSHVTHMFSGMSGLRRVDAYRVSGVIESTLLIDELTTELIADGHHLPPSLMKLVLKNKSLDKIAIVTDAMAAAGLGKGEYELGGLDVTVEDKVAEPFELSTRKGNFVAKLLDRSAFAGSVATMDQLVRNMVQLVGLSVQDAVKTATINPARILGIDDHLGLLQPGYHADLVLFDKEFNIHKVLVGGKIFFEA